MEAKKSWSGTYNTVQGATSFEEWRLKGASSFEEWRLVSSFEECSYNKGANKLYTTLY